MSKESTANSLSIIISTDKSPQTIGSETISLPHLEGWDELDSKQQQYLTALSQNPLKRKTISAQLGLGGKLVDKWFNSSPFADIASLITDIYCESLKTTDMVEAQTNSKIRNRVIQSLERDGKYTQEPKEVNENHLHITMADFLKLQEKKG